MTTFVDNKYYELRVLEQRLKRHIEKELIGMTYDHAFLYVADKLDEYKKTIEELEQLVDERLKEVIK